ncbi:MAG: hypothetical protein BGP11_05430 [Rhodobacterales bacterium 65-51]|nr:MAG: hypothetical protein BGP11_05430 [Rhodobacterales bacterium 65-51]
MHVNVSIKIEGDSPCFGKTEVEAKAIVAQYLRELADQIEHHVEDVASGDIEDNAYEVIVGRVSFAFAF